VNTIIVCATWKKEIGVTTESETPVTAELAAPRRGVGAVAMEAIRAGKSNEETLALIQDEFPDKRTTLASVNWYRNHLRKKLGEPVPTSTDIRRAREAANPTPKVEKVKKPSKAQQAAANADAAMAPDAPEETVETSDF